MATKRQNKDGSLDLTPDYSHRIKRMSDVSEEKLRWLWRKMLPVGKITIADGDPGGLFISAEEE